MALMMSSLRGGGAVGGSVRTDEVAGLVMAGFFFIVVGWWMSGLLSGVEKVGDDCDTCHKERDSEEEKTIAGVARVVTESLRSERLEFPFVGWRE